MRHNRTRKQGDNTQENRVKDRIITVFLLISLFLFIGSVIQTTKKIGNVNKEVSNRQEELKKLQNEQKTLEAKLKQVTSPEYTEKQLRDQLNLSKENEITLVLPEEDLLRKLVPPDDNAQQVDLTSNYLKWAEVFGIKL